MTIIVNGEEYVKAEKHQMAKKDEAGRQYVIARTYSAGVFAGYIQNREGKEIHLVNARRIWRWEGAASLSQLAMEGTSKPEECKFPCAVESVLLTELIELLPCTEKARLSIEGVPVWSA